MVAVVVGTCSVCARQCPPAMTDIIRLAWSLLIILLQLACQVTAHSHCRGGYMSSCIISCTILIRCCVCAHVYIAHSGGNAATSECALLLCRSTYSETAVWHMHAELALLTCATTAAIYIPGKRLVCSALEFAHCNTPSWPHWRVRCTDSVSVVSGRSMAISPAIVSSYCRPPLCAAQ